MAMAYAQMWGQLCGCLVGLRHWYLSKRVSAALGHPLRLLLLASVMALGRLLKIRLPNDNKCFIFVMSVQLNGMCGGSSSASWIDSGQLWFIMCFFFPAFSGHRMLLETVNVYQCCRMLGILSFSFLREKGNANIYMLQVGRLMTTGRLVVCCAIRCLTNFYHCMFYYYALWQCLFGHF